jgi:glyoxylase-like metal-dependent hydrolase (beta-lactamase superfamily II)
MSAQNHFHFKIGSFDCNIVNDGTFAYPHPAQLLFTNVSQGRLQQALQKHNILLEDWEVYVSPYPSLLINTGQQLVLVDCGAGKLAPTTGKLVGNLRAAGVDPERINTVIITHAHPDHVGGAVAENGKPAFPNARYIMAREEWDFWNSEPDLSALQIPEQLKEIIVETAKTMLPPLQDRLDLIDPDTEIVPGIRAVGAPGHTPGHLALDIVSAGERLLAITDAFVHPVHITHPEWVAAFDYVPEQVVTTRQHLLERAVEEKALVFAYHFPSPGLGYITQEGQRWQWESFDIRKRT